MATDVDHALEVYSKLWALLEAPSRSFVQLVKPANRIKLAGGVGSGLYPFKTNSQDSDYPEAALVVAESTLTDEAKTFAMYNAGASYLIVWEQTYALTLTLPDLRLGKATELARSAVGCLLAGGPRLGLSYVHRRGPLAQKHQIVASSVSEEGMPQGTQRYVVSIRIPVTFRVPSTDLI